MPLHRAVLTFGLALAVDVVGLASLPSTAVLNAKGDSPALPNMTMELLTHFIVVPEHKLLFCYMEKVGCTNFNNLFRFLRERYDPSQAEMGPWQRNNPVERGVAKLKLKDLLIDKSWHKAIFYREPMERFVSAFRSKCEGADGKEGHDHCKHMFGNENVSFDEAVSQIRKFDANHGDDIAAEKALDEHFRQQTDFCGGLAATLRYYDTVEELDRDTAHVKVAKLLETIGVKAETVPHFNQLFPPLGDESWERKGHNTNSGDELREYFPEDNPNLALALMHHYRRDYETFGITPPEWAPKSKSLAPRGASLPRISSPFLSKNSRFAPSEAQSQMHAKRARWPL